MNAYRLVGLLLSSALLVTGPAAPAFAQPRESAVAFPADPPKHCSNCDEWNAPREPFRLFGNAYFVGVAGLGSVLVTSPKGHILLDGALPQSAALIDASIRRLGFETRDVRLILSSHAHFDHAGGIAALQRASGATVAASAAGAVALAAGGTTPDDPQHGLGLEVMAFPAVKDIQVVKDGEAVRVGDLAVTAHYTPGHTPGATTWTWRSCEGKRCLDMVYADSLTSVSAPGFRYTGDASHPSIEASFRKSIATVRALPCDVVVSVHPGFTDLDQKIEARAAAPAHDPFVDPNGCRAYADAMRKRLDDRVAEERASPKP